MLSRVFGWSQPEREKDGERKEIAFFLCLPACLPREKREF
jgi:hypothetical protein